MLKALPKNVFEAILQYGHDEDYEGIISEDFLPTSEPAGSDGKIEVLRERIERGMPLWHEDDRVDYAGLCGAALAPRNSFPNTYTNRRSPISLDRYSGTSLPEYNSLPVQDETTKNEHGPDTEDFSQMALNPSALLEYQKLEALNAEKDRDVLGEDLLTLADILETDDTATQKNSTFQEQEQDEPDFCLDNELDFFNEPQDILKSSLESKQQVLEESYILENTQQPLLPEVTPISESDTSTNSNAATEVISENLEFMAFGQESTSLKTQELLNVFRSTTTPESDSPKKIEHSRHSVNILLSESELQNISSADSLLQTIAKEPLTRDIVVTKKPTSSSTKKDDFYYINLMARLRAEGQLL